MKKYIKCPQCNHSFEINLEESKFINQDSAFLLLDKIIENVEKYKSEPLFSNEIRIRKERNPEMFNSDADFLKEIIDLISYSQNARSDSVYDIWKKTNVFQEAFHDFNVNVVADSNLEEVIQKYWHKLKAIRFKKKINSMIKCAQVMKTIAGEHESFLIFFNKANIPLNIYNTDDLDRFWKGFDYLMLEFKKVEMPFLGNVTTLLHLLLNMGYFCVKPDLVLLKFADKINVSDKKNFVRLLQEYCLSRNIKPSVIDLYLLINGSQLGVKNFVKPEYKSI